MKNRYQRLRYWLSCQTPFCQALVLYLTPLGIFLLITFFVWMWHWSEGVTSPEDSQHLLARVGVVQYIAAVAMLIFVRRWPLQSLGLFGLLLAGAELKYRMIARHGPQPVPEWERDLTQAFFETATTAIALAISIYAVKRFLAWKNRTPEPETTEEKMW